MRQKTHLTYYLSQLKRLDETIEEETSVIAVM